MSELTAKCRGLPVEAYGALDFYFPYAAAGLMVQFFVLQRDNGGTLIKRQTAPFFLDDPDHRWAIINVVRNIIRLAPLMVEKLPRIRLRLYGHIGDIREGRVVAMVEGQAKKTVYSSMKPLFPHVLCVDT
eukprot:Opistho-2@38799